MTEVIGDSQLQTEVLEDLRDASRYRTWLCDLARPFLGEHPIEIGSGIGDYAEELARDTRRFTATEADRRRFRLLRDRFCDHPTIEPKYLSLPVQHDAEHSSAVAFNVLEHIPDHVAAVRGMARLTEPGSPIVLIVPAFPSAMSGFDRAIGHERRYTKDSLLCVLRACGLHVEELRYINPIGLLGWYLAVKAMRMKPRNGALLRAYDRVVVPLAQAAEHHIHPPFGQSVFAVARAR